MDATLNFFYDKKGDILDISLGPPQPAISDEVGNDVIVRYHPETDEIIGFTILNFERRFEQNEKRYELPVMARFFTREAIAG